MAHERELPTTPVKRRGRPPSTRAQDAVKAAATALFAENGYSETSIRDIATAAKVDPAIVMRHFGSKEGLFLETMSVDEGFRGITEGPLRDLGRTILERLVGRLGPEGGRIFAVLMGAVDRADVRSYLLESANRHLVAPLAARLSGRDAEVRARLVAAQVTGLMIDLWVVEDPGLAEAPMDVVISAYAPALQALLDG